MKEYCESNRNAIRESQKQYYEQYKDVMKFCVRKHYEQNKDAKNWVYDSIMNRIKMLNN